MAQQVINNGDSGFVARAKINGNFDRLNGTVNSRTFIGFDAGAFETEDDRLHITSLTAAQQVNEATARTKAIIYGVQDTITANQILAFNARVGIGTIAPTSRVEVREDHNDATRIAVTNLTPGSASLAGLLLQGEGNNIFVESYSDSHSTRALENWIETTAGGTDIILATAIGEVLRVSAAGNTICTGTQTADDFIIA